MADLRTAKQTVRDWLKSKIRIDNFDLDFSPNLFHPSSTAENILPANAATEYPIRDLRYERTALNEVIGYAGITYSVAYRFTGSLTAHQLPTKDIEAIAQFLYVSAVMELPSCSPIKDIDPEVIEFPVQITRTDGEQSDWLIILHFILAVSFEVDEIGLPGGYGPIDSASDDEFNYDGVKLSVFRAVTGDLDDNTLDAELIFPKA